MPHGSWAPLFLAINPTIEFMSEYVHLAPNKERKAIPDEVAAGSSQHTLADAEPSEAEYQCIGSRGIEYKVG